VLLQTLVDLGLTDDWQHMIDSTSVRGHVSAAGRKGRQLRTLLVDHAAALRTNPSPVRQSGTAPRLHPDRRRGLRLHRSPATDDHPSRRAQGAPCGQGLPRGSLPGEPADSWHPADHPAPLEPQGCLSIPTIAATETATASSACSASSTSST
jgi:hypothetical protein